ncbi:MAG: cell division protein FtsZ [Armatimonadota bacterium]|jgi:cell division protein FtsZ
MLKPEVEEYAKIRVVGVGGGGTNAVNRMIEVGLVGVQYVAVNTDMQVLDLSAADAKLQIGTELTKGLGAGGDPEIGRQAAESGRQDLMMALDDADMVFITAGMGGGTGTGAGPVIASVAREIGALTIGVVTKPFGFEGPHRQTVAEEGTGQLKEACDTLIVIPNDRLLALTEKQLSVVEAFAFADTILQQGVQGISEVIVVPGLINLDFADVRAVMENAGTALMGIGHSSGEHRAHDAAHEAIASPLLETTIGGARKVLVNVTHGRDFLLEELREAMEVINEAAAGDDGAADLVVGSVIDDTAEGEVRITVLATGFDVARPAAPKRPETEESDEEEPEEEPEQAEQPEERPAQERAELPTYDEDDIDIPAFLRRR